MLVYSLLLQFSYDKGDYDGLRSYINCDWNDEFVKVNFEVEPMWNIIKDKFETGVKRFIPLSSSFNCRKWKRPL